jgi:hypothetical protein
MNASRLRLAKFACTRKAVGVAQRIEMHQLFTIG